MSANTGAGGATAGQMRAAGVWSWRRRPGSFVACLLVAGMAVLPGLGRAQGAEPRLLIPPTGAGSGTLTPPPPAPSPSPSPQVAPVQTTGPAAPAAPAAARLDVRITQLEEDLRTLTGRLEEVAFQVRKLDDRLNKALADMEYRLSQARPGGDDAGAAPTVGSAGGGAASASGVGAASATPRSGGSAPAADAARPAAPAATSVAGLPPRDQYARSLSLLEKRNYDDAAAGFSEFLKQNPNDPLADNARYWLGETYYARGDYARAAQQFLEGYEKNKDGPKAPDTLLKLGLSLSALDKKKEACATFHELGKVFPNAPDAVRDRAAQESKRIACS